VTPGTTVHCTHRQQIYTCNEFDGTKEIDRTVIDRYDDPNSNPLKPRSDNMKILESEKLVKLFRAMYGTGTISVEAQVSRYRSLAQNYRKCFGEGELQFFSTPGRTEIAGNHTDHNGGIVLAGSVHLDTIAAVCPTGENMIRVFSEGYDEEYEVHLDALHIRSEERETTSALIRGIAFRMVECGYNVGGFNACISSNVGMGSGLSSSASVEVLLATIINCLYNHGDISMLELAKIGRYAENTFFMKPCGLMDQIACGYGGIVSIDFADIDSPVVRRVDVDMAEFGYRILVVRTGSDHADLTRDYASITEDMRSAASFFNREICRELSFDDILQHNSVLRDRAGDRSFLRSYHFLMENERVAKQVKALEGGDMKAFLSLVQCSGNSSAQWLQNAFSTRNPTSQPITVALALTEYFFRNRHDAAFRVHGGGFAGTIQVFSPEACCDEYIHFMENKIGAGTVTTLQIRPYGSMHVNEYLSQNGVNVS
jgi:galactokinase